MGSLATRRVSGFATVLKLGRVSNLPTVWSNVIAATALAGGAPLRTIVVLAAAMSLMYVGGMFLNDAFDAATDARERPERPIPSGAISAASVFASGFGLLAAGIALLAAIDLRTAAVGIALASAIVFYDAYHKQNPLSPFVMGACRALVYVAAAVAATATASPFVIVAALSILGYVAGLTYAARAEAFDRLENVWPLPLLAAPLVLAVTNLDLSGAALLALAAYLAGLFWIALFLARRGPGDVRRAVGLLIAGIAVNDAVLAATTGAHYATYACLACFALTLLLQRHVPAS
jgi:4-hydroxybenzoate polyprenyltransferase